MNDKLNLVKILKDCPRRTPLYSTIHGSVVFIGINYKDNIYPIEVEVIDDDGFLNTECYSSDGRFHHDYNGECVLFPSKEQRDWSKFKVKKPKFDPKTLNPFNKVLVKDHDHTKWKIDFFSHIDDDDKLRCLITSWKLVIPYNNDTKHLVGTSEKAPEYYRYWEVS